MVKIASLHHFNRAGVKMNVLNIVQYRTVFQLGLVTSLILLTACSKQADNTYQGYVEGEFVYMATSQPGQLINLAVQRGQTVSNNTLLFALESQNELDAVNQAQHQLKFAQSQYADLLTGRRPPEIDVTQAQLIQARADAQRASLQLQRDEEQYRAEGIAKAQLDDSRAAAAVAAGHVSELQAQLQVARLPGRKQQVLAQNAQVDAAQAALAQAQWKLDQKQVRAPHAGLVFDTMYRSGEWVAAGNPVVRMLPPENIKVRFFVPGALVSTMQAGRKLRIRCDGCSADVAASITYVSDQAEYTPQNIYSNDTRSKFVFMIEAHPSPTDAVKLHPGQPVEVTVL
jgi:HlyD family secretion protein